MKEKEIIDGKWEILAILGKGLSNVYKVRHVQLNCVRTLKSMDSCYLDNNTLRSEFLSEACLSLLVNHPNVIRIHEIVSNDEICYFVMDYIDGISLYEIIKRHGYLSEERASDIALQILSVLTKAHRMGFVHSNINPSNILIDRTGRAYLSGFGEGNIALYDMYYGSLKARVWNFYEPYEPERETHTYREIRSYKTDIYSLGVVLYNLVVGSPPFEDWYSFLKYELPDPCSINPDISDNFASIIMRAMERDPEKRFSSAEEMAKAIEGK